MKPTSNSLAPTTNKVERLKKYLKATTKTERLAFVCCVYVGIWEVIFKIM